MATVEYLKRNGISRAGRVYVVEVRTRVRMSDGREVVFVGGRLPKLEAIRQAEEHFAKAEGA